MGTKQSLYKANKVKDDEFYTLYEDVANEVSRYKEQLTGKKILCPCDWDESYNEEIVYKEEGFVGPSNLLDSGGTIKKINIKASKEKIEKELSLINCNFVKFLVNKKGKVVDRFTSLINPSSESIKTAIEKEIK